MSRDVFRAYPNDKLHKAAYLMRAFHVSGLPVVDKTDHVVGIISEVDLLRDLHHSTGVVSPRGFLDLLLDSGPERGPSLLQSCRRRLKNARVSERMSRKVVTVDEDTTFSESLHLLDQYHINRLPVVDAEHRLVGIVTRSDVIGALGAGLRPTRGALFPRTRLGPRGRKMSLPFQDA
ncbi:MAG: CBS domain-containing protein [Thermoplasmata archaeon]